MGKKGSWFSAVKKAISHNFKETKDKKPDKSKKKWFQRQESMDVISFLEESPLDVPPIEDDVKQTKTEDEQSEHASSMAAEPAVAAAQPAMEVERPIRSCYLGKSKEEIAAIEIQTAFRGYTARRALRALKALMRLKSLVQGQSIKRQVASTLKRMQTIAHVQSEIRARRLRMSEENRALQQQLRHKREKEVERSQTSMDEDWNHSTQSKSQVEAKLLNKKEAAVRRERAMAYAFSRQQTWKNSSKTSTPTVMDPNNPHWGWSWLERWMAARPWEPRSTTDRQDHEDQVSVASVASRAPVGDITQMYYARRDQNLPIKPSPKAPTSQKSPSTHKAQSSSSSGRKKINPPSQRIGSCWGGDDDSKSMSSVKSKLSRRHSIAGSPTPFRDDESLASLPSVTSYTTPPKAVKARSRVSSSSGTAEKKGTMEKGSAGSAKKRLSFTRASSPAQPRRLSSPPCVNTS